MEAGRKDRLGGSYGNEDPSPIPRRARFSFFLLSASPRPNKAGSGIVMPHCSAGVRGRDLPWPLGQNIKGLRMEISAQTHRLHPALKGKRAELGYSLFPLWPVAAAMARGRGTIPATRPIKPVRVETPALLITRRKNDLTVFGLIPMCWAISLLVNPLVKNPTASRSRSVRRHPLQSSWIVVSNEPLRSKRITTVRAPCSPCRFSTYRVQR